MTAVFLILTVQALMGAFDNLWHHELAARLPQRPAARRELALHALREALYGLLFLGFAWVQWQGWWVLLPVTMLAVEFGVTAADFVEEDRSRRLPPFERVLHTALAVSFGVLVGVLAPLFAEQAHLPTQWRWTTHGLWSVFFTLAGIVVIAWSLRNAQAVRRLRESVQDSKGPGATAAATAPVGPAVLVTGATGFIGAALVRQLQSEGRRVIVHGRDLLQARACFGPDVWAVDRLDDIPHETRIEAIVNLAGAAVLGWPWTARQRRLLIDSRVQTSRRLLDLLHRLGQRPAVWVQASAVGYYGVPDGAVEVVENHPAQSGRFQSDLCAQTEHEAQRARALGVRVVSLRLGIVLGIEGGAWPAQALAARWGLGALLGSGRQPLPWIHLDDALGLIRHAIGQASMDGPINAVAPQQVTQAEFAGALAQACGRQPNLGLNLRVPAGLLQRLLGEMSELLLCGQRASAARALACGYRFRHSGLEPALAALVVAHARRSRPGCRPAPGPHRA